MAARTYDFIDYNTGAPMVKGNISTGHNAGLEYARLRNQIILWRDNPDDIPRPPRDVWEPLFEQIKNEMINLRNRYTRGGTRNQAISIGTGLLINGHRINIHGNYYKRI